MAFAACVCLSPLPLTDCECDVCETRCLVVWIACESWKFSTDPCPSQFVWGCVLCSCRGLASSWGERTLVNCQWALVNWEVKQCGCPLLGSVGLESEAHLVSDCGACCSLWAKHGQIGSNIGQTESEHHDSLGWQARGRANCLGVPGESVGESHHDCQDGNVAIWGVGASVWTLQQRGCGREWVCQI